MNVFVLDSWPVLAWFKREQPAARHVRILFEAAARGRTQLIMSVVNLGEVLYVSAKTSNLARAERIVAKLKTRVVIAPVSDGLVIQAATFKARYRISYADGFAVATALLRDAPLVTGDPELKAMSANEKALKLEWIGQ